MYWHRSRIYVKLLKQCEASDPCADHHNGFLASLPTPVPYEPALLDFSCCAQGIMDIVHEWPPEFIGMNTPFIATLLLGPAKINLRVLQHRESIDFRKGVASSVASSQKAILKLAVEKVARYWKFGSILLGMNTSPCLTSRPSSNGVSDHRRVSPQRPMNEVLSLRSYSCADYLDFHALGIQVLNANNKPTGSSSNPLSFC